MRLCLVACLSGVMPLAVCQHLCVAETISAPRFTARVDKETPGRAVQIDVEIAGAKQLYLVVTGSNYGWADWAEPRLTGPQGELKLTDQVWTFACVGYAQPHVNANVQGDKLKIDGQPVSYGIGVHDPSLVIYDVPDGYTHFKARGGLDSGGSQGPVTFAVYADNPLFDTKNPALWTRNHSQQRIGEPETYIEMFGGDRLPGEVVEPPESDGGTSAMTPDGFFVRPAGDLNKTGDVDRDVVRVIRRFVRRIVWQRSRSDFPGYAPGTAWYRNGARVVFRAARFRAGDVRLLTPDGVVTEPITELARIDLPPRDPWEAYCDELAMLSPRLQTDLLQLETSGGLIATLSPSRLRCLPPRHHDAKPLRWRVGIQPAWALDMLWLPHTEIVARRQTAPHRISLTRLSPIKTVLGGAIGGGSWPPQKNRNVQGGPLATAGKVYAWGFGTQADTELHFAMDRLVQSLRTRVGLDQLAGTGGCARARIFAGPTTDRPLWESPLLVGSSQDVDTNTIRLPQKDDTTGQLVLQADAAHDQRPKNADPFDIRDFVDWVDPELQLDEAKLRSQVAEAVRPWVPAWSGWDVHVDGGDSLWLDSVWSEFDSRPSHFRIAIGAGKRPLRLSRTVDVDASASRLLLTVCRPPETGEQPVQVEVLVDDQSIHRGEIRTRLGDHRKPAQIEVSLAEYVGQRVTLTILQHASDEQAAVEWSAIQLLGPVVEATPAETKPAA